MSEISHDRGISHDSGSERSAVWSQEIPARNPHFTGRAGELTELARRLAQGSVGLLSQPAQAIFGLGGVGKTEIATEFAHRHAGEYQIVWWVRAEHEDRIRDSFVRLGRRLNLAQTDGQRDKSIWAVMDALRNGPYRRWLLIFDNAADPAIIHKYLPSGPPGGHVIITSREQQWRRHTRAEGIEITEFELEETISFLRKRVPALAAVQPSGVPLDLTVDRARHDEAARLALALGNLPIAADHAAAYLVETGTNVDMYLKMFNENPLELLSQAVDIDYPQVVATTWSISTRRLGVDATELFNLCAFFSPEPIAEELFLAGGEDPQMPRSLREVLIDPRRFRQAVRRLHRYSLAKIDGKRNVLTVHRVVQAVTRGQVEVERPEASGEYRTAAHILLAASDPRNPDRENNDAQYDRSVQHLRPSGAIETDNRALRRLIINQVRRLHLRGGHEEGLRLGEEALAVWRRKLGANDEQVLHLAVEVGIAMRLAGRAEEARELNRQTLELLRKEYGEDNETTLICANSYGGDLRAVGRFQEALELDLRLLPLFEQVFLADHDRTLNVRNNLGADYRRLGKFREALAQDQLTYSARERILGRSDLRTLASKDAVSFDLRGCGQYEEALEVARDVVTLLNDRAGTENPDWLNAQKGFAVALRKAGHYSDALNESEEALRRYDIYLGKRHRYSLRAAINRINDLRLTEQLTEAEELGRETLTLCRETQSPLEITYAALVNLAIVVRLRGNPEDARVMDEEAFQGMSEYFGADHPLTLAAATNLASDLSAVGELTAAREVGERTLEASRATRGASHPDTLAIAANLSLDLRAAGFSDESAELRAATLRAYDDVLSMEDPIARVAQQRGRVNVDIEPY